MNNTEARFLFGISGENSEIVSCPSKLVVNHEQTPIKRPFKDTTNKSSDLLKKTIDNELQLIAAKNEQIKTEKMHCIQNDFNGFRFPSHENCFCCANDTTKLIFEEANALYHLCDLIYMNRRIPEEEVLKINEEDKLQILPINYDEYDTNLSLTATTFWTNFCNFGEEREKNYCSVNPQNNSSFHSIPEFIDDSIEYEEPW